MTPERLESIRLLAAEDFESSVVSDLLAHIAELSSELQSCRHANVNLANDNAERRRECSELEADRERFDLALRSIHAATDIDTARRRATNALTAMKQAEKST